VKNVCLDIRYLNAKPTGVGRYIKNMTEHLLRMPSPQLRYFLLGCPENFKNINADPNVYTPLLSPYPPEKHPQADWWFNTGFLSLLQKQGVDLFHSTAISVPLRKPPFKYLCTIHDLVGFYFPDSIPIPFRWFLNIQLRLALRHSEALICMSHSTKNQLEQTFLRAPPINVIPLACPEPRLKPSVGDSGFPFSYILYVGNIEPRKGVLDLMRGFERYRIQNPDAKEKLVLCGQTLWNYEEPQRLAENSPFKDSIVFTGYVTENELERYYLWSRLTVIPSHYEGFGIPVLEAMRAKAPILVNDISVLTEIGGSDVYPVKIYNPDALAAKIRDLLCSKEKHELREIRYTERLKRYTWFRCAQSTKDLYEQILF
jgi:glycosyltransferase involved in cell wall biosynthesis